MKWFKHYTNAHKGGAIQILRPHFSKAEAYGLYFLFTEFLADKWDGSGEPNFKVFKNELSSFLGLKQKKLSLFLVCLQNESKMSFKETEDFFEIEFPKLLEIKHRDSFPSSQRPAKNQPNGPPILREEKEEEKEWLYGSAEALKKAVSIVDQDFFKKAYPDAEWVDRQTELCFRHFSADDAKRPRTKGQWMQKLQSWLESNWQRKQDQAAKGNVVPLTGGWD